MSSRHLGTRARQHLNLADINTKCAVNDHLYDCTYALPENIQWNLSKFLKSVSPSVTLKFQEALLSFID